MDLGAQLRYNQANSGFSLVKVCNRGIQDRYGNVSARTVPVNT